MNTAPWVVWLVPCLFVWGCATSRDGVTKTVELTIEVRHLDGRLQWRTSQQYESGTDDPPGVNERIGK